MRLVSRQFWSDLDYLDSIIQKLKRKRVRCQPICYRCACGDLFKNKTLWVIHLLALSCYDENLKMKGASER